MGEGDQVLRRQGGVSSNSRIEGSFQVFSVFARRQCSFLHGGILERDDFSLNRHPALPYCWSMIFSENRSHFSGSCSKPNVLRPCQKLCDLACTIDEKLRHWADSPVFQSDDCH